jgi:hypothetical protein
MKPERRRKNEKKKEAKIIQDICKRTEEERRWRKEE